MARRASRSSATRPRCGSGARPDVVIGELDELDTEVLRLRRWTDADRPDIDVLHPDPQVMATIGAVMARDELGRVHGPHRAALRPPRVRIVVRRSRRRADRFHRTRRAWFRNGVEVGWRHPIAVLGVAGTHPSRRHAVGSVRVRALTRSSRSPPPINTNSQRADEKIGLVREPPPTPTSSTRVSRPCNPLATARPLPDHATTSTVRSSEPRSSSVARTQSQPVWASRRRHIYGTVTLDDYVTTRQRDGRTSWLCRSKPTSPITRAS